MSKLEILLLILLCMSWLTNLTTLLYFIFNKKQKRRTRMKPIFDKKEFKKALEKRDKNVLIDIVCQYKWERDYSQEERNKAEDECIKLEKALAILASIFVRETTFGKDDKEEMRNKKNYIVAFAKEVADYIINGSFENENETEI